MELKEFKIVIGTNNKGKFEEFKNALEPHGIICVMPLMKLEVEENGVTYRENALIKARAFAQEMGLPTLSDDTGLEIDALGGRPGLISARYSGAGEKTNVEKVLSEMRDIPDQKRTARFKCVLALTLPNKKEIATEGVCEGRILKNPKGRLGFGYDSIFMCDGLDKTFAEMSMEEKTNLSHRGKAIIKLLELIKVS